jgi:hypothetical protein
MDHVVCLDEGAKELENLVNGNKSMILRGDDVINLHFSQVKKGDMLYFVKENGITEVMAKGIVSSVCCTGRLTEEESYETVIRNQDRLQLPDSQFYNVAGKKYLLLIGLDYIEEIRPFSIGAISFTGKNDLFPVGNISSFPAQEAVNGFTPASR